MKTYSVTIEATIRKTYTVVADTKADASMEAHELFTVNCEDDIDEAYEQTILDITEVNHE